MITKNINNTYGINNLVVSGTLTVTDGTNNNVKTAIGGSGDAQTIDTTSDNTNGTCYLTYTTSSAGTNKTLCVDDTTTPLSYNPSTSTLTCSYINAMMVGSTDAQTVDITSDDSNANCYLTFSKTTAGTNKILYVDDTTTPLTYNPFQATLNAGYYVSTNGTYNASTTNGNCGLFGSTQQVKLILVLVRLQEIVMLVEDKKQQEQQI